MIKGTFFAWLAVMMCVVFSIGMLSKGLSNSWIGLVLAILIIGFFLSEEDEHSSSIDSKQDYKARYTASDEYNTADMITREDIDETIDSMRK